MTIKINGTNKHRVTPDSQVMQQFSGGQQQSGITNINESSELGDSLRELNDDSNSSNSKMSNIDMRSRLHYTEIGSILAVDTLVDFNFLPTECLSFTRQKKRLAVSLKGRGREEIVQIVGGKREQEQGATRGLVNMFKKRE